MFRFFHKNKMQCNKGQMMPVFILILVILLIMAMVTVNLGKISLMKTDTSNAADAGALAGGSTMANYFNQQAVANSHLIVNYQYFKYGGVALAAAIVVAALAAAVTCAANSCPHPISCCSSPGCIKFVADTVSVIKDTALALIIFQIAQFISYKSLRKHSGDGRANAMNLAYRLAFYNSGIGGKLISGKAPLDLGERRDNEFNYSARFNKFIEDTTATGEDVPAPPAHLDYAWTDNQAREHLVRVKAITDSTNDYELRYTKLPNWGLLLILYGAIKVSTLSATSCATCPCSAGAMFGFAAAIAGIMTGYLAGIEPAGGGEKESGATDLQYPICWIDDIDHDRLFRVETWQVHQGQKYGLWETKYPKEWDPDKESAEYIENHPDKRISSFGLVNFNGYGGYRKLYPVDPHFDADLIETD